MLCKVSINQAILDLLTANNILMLKSMYHHDTSIKLGDTLVFEKNLEVYPYTSFLAGNALFSMGIFSYSRSELGGENNRSNVSCVKIGRYCSIADHVRVFQNDHIAARYTTSNLVESYPRIYFESKQIKDRETEKKKLREHKVSLSDIYDCREVRIGNDVWIGSHVALKPGISVGDGACIGTGAIVTKDVPPYAIMAGVPAKVIKYRFDDVTIERLLAFQWWEYDFLDFKVHPDETIDRFIETVGRQIEDGEISPYKPSPLKADDLLNLKG